MTTINGVSGQQPAQATQPPETPVSLLDESLKKTRLGSVFTAAVNTAKDTKQFNMNNLAVFDTDGTKGLSAEEMRAGITKIQASNRKTINKDRYTGPQQNVTNSTETTAAFTALTALNNETGFEFYDWKGRRGDHQEAERTAQIQNNQRNAAQSSRVILDRLDENTLTNLLNDAIGNDTEAEEVTENEAATISTPPEQPVVAPPVPPVNPEVATETTATPAANTIPPTGSEGAAINFVNTTPPTGSEGAAINFVNTVPPTGSEGAATSFVNTIPPTGSESAAINFVNTTPPTGSEGAAINFVNTTPPTGSEGATTSFVNTVPPTGSTGASTITNIPPTNGTVPMPNSDGASNSQLIYDEVTNAFIPPLDSNTYSGTLTFGPTPYFGEYGMQQTTYPMFSSPYISNEWLISTAIPTANYLNEDFGYSGPLTLRPFEIDFN